jgi:hypothetical protein
MCKRVGEIRQEVLSSAAQLVSLKSLTALLHDKPLALFVREAERAHGSGFGYSTARRIHIARSADDRVVTGR